MAGIAYKSVVTEDANACIVAPASGMPASMPPVTRQQLFKRHDLNRLAQ